MKRKFNKGFTLLEMLIVVAIIAIIIAFAAIAVDRNQKSMEQLELDGMAREIYFAAQNHLTAADTQGLIEQLITDSDNTDAAKELKLGKQIVGYKNDPADDDEVAKSDVYCVVGTDTDSGKDILRLMLPKDALDTISTQGKGTFFILYQKSSATVLDVFYTAQEGRFGIAKAGRTSFVEDDYETLKNLRGDAQRSARRSVSGLGGAMIGYYGGEDAQKERITLKPPEIKIENADRLKVIVSNPNTDSSVFKYATLEVIITGVESKKNAVESVTIPLLTTEKTGVSNPTFTTLGYTGLKTAGDYSTIEIVLDDITVNDKDTEGHFATKFPALIPGEDIQVQAKVYSSNRYANIAWSAVALTNSLFADPYTYTSGQTVLGSDVAKGMAAVASFRHLENLDARISSVGYNDSTFKITDAAQIADIDWTKFRTNVSENNVEPIASGVEVTDKCYVPVTPQYYSSDYANSPIQYSIKYDGQNHSVSNVAVDFAGDAGLFGKLDVADSSVKNLELIDFDITASNGNAGALAGIATSANITNVLAHNTVAYETKKASDITAITGSETADIAKKAAILQDITAPTSYDAGGLIGSATNCTVSKCAAALVVNGGTNAGGLIGSSSGGTVSASYSGGHTYSGKPEGTSIEKYDTSGIYPVRYYFANASASTDAEKNLPLYNVTATTNAGGLIGSASDVAIEYSYSTCSASADIAGGLAGSVNDGSIKNSYCTGLVPDVTDTLKYRGAFAGSLTGTPEVTECHYFEIVNEYREMKGDNLTSGYHYLGMLGNGGTNSGITAIDASATSYNEFCGAPASWAEANPYDAGGTTATGLKVFYKVNGETKYNFKTVAQLGATLKSSDSDTTVYFVNDHYGDWPAPEEFIFN